MSEREDYLPQGSDHLYEILVEAGVEVLIGLPGTQTLPLDRTVAERDEIEYVMSRHETAIPHTAWGYYESGGGLAATLTVPGPGDTNVMHGLKNALQDQVPIIHIAADVDPEDRGKGPIHEIEHDTYNNVVKENIAVTRPFNVRQATARAVEIATTPPYGPVRLGVSKSILSNPCVSPEATVSSESTVYDVTESVDLATDALATARRPVVYAGVGARRSPGAAEQISRLATRLDAPVFVSYKGKGVYPEDDDRFAGVTGSHLPAGGIRVLDHADVVIGLGTEFDGVTTAGWSIPMGETLVHVSTDPDAFDVAYDADVRISADVATVVDDIVDGLATHRVNTWDGGAIARAVREEYRDHLHEMGQLPEQSPPSTPSILERIRESLPRGTAVTTDVGGGRLWAAQLFSTYGAELYTTAGAWAGMGVGLPAAIGAKLADRDRPAACLTGDGGLMMCIHELHTAVEADLPVVVIVFKNDDFGVISKSPEIAEYGDGHRFGWGGPDFVTIAEGFGCHGVRATDGDAVDEAIQNALDREQPTLIEVPVDGDEPTAATAADYESTVDFS